MLVHCLTVTEQLIDIEFVPAASPAPHAGLRLK
jgi:hypothetical protein